MAYLKGYLKFSKRVKVPYELNVFILVLGKIELLK